MCNSRKEDVLMNAMGMGCVRKGYVFATLLLMERRVRRQSAPITATTTELAMEHNAYAMLGSLASIALNESALTVVLVMGNVLIWLVFAKMITQSLIVP
jgi:hypothetical protein